MTAYYNEHDPYAAQWLRNLIAAGEIAPGFVDERSIEDVKPSDLIGYTQCHFFAGIGVWSYALRRAGWPDDRPVWSGSCPCQPFSSAGKGEGFADERHLWPAFHHLIRECNPPVVLGEQVASKDSGPWIDLVHTDLEGLGYAFGAVPFPSAGVGAPHIRDRLYWVADATGRGRGKEQPDSRGRDARNGAGQAVLRAGGGDLGGLADASQHRSQGRVLGRADAQRRMVNRPAGRDGATLQPCEFCGYGQQRANDAYPSGGTGRMADAEHARSSCSRHDAQPQSAQQFVGHSSAAGFASEPTGSTNGFWAAADWLLCRDGRWRPVEPGTFPLVDGSSGGVGRSRADWHAPAGEAGFGHRAGRLKGYGNAINAEAAIAFVRAFTEPRL